MRILLNVFQRFNNPSFYLFCIIVIAFIMRVQYSFGHIFSDDAYYAYLSKTLLDLNYTNDFLGYPIYPLRINMYLFTALSFSIFGTNEFATIVFPMIFSLINVVLIYKLTLLISKNYNCSILAALLLAFSPSILFMQQLIL